MNTHHALYRFYDQTGALLYVGITSDPGARWPKHRRDKPWWHDVATITVEVHPDRDTVLAAERTAIVNECPRYNIVHNSGAGLRRDEAPVVDIDMPDDCHEQCVPAGREAIYLPHRWANGQALYQCDRGHQWTCWWGHTQSGHAPERRGVPYVVLNTGGAR